MRPLLPLCVLLLSATLSSIAAAEPATTDGPRSTTTAMVDAAGGLQLDGIGELECGLYDQDWQYRSALPKGDPLAHDRGFSIPHPRGGAVAGVAAFAKLDGAQAGAVSCRYTFTADRDLQCNALAVSLSLPLAEAGATWSVRPAGENAPEVRGELPITAGEPHLYAGSVRALTLNLSGGRTLALEFATPTTVLLQDNRRWGPSFSLRIGQQPAQLAAGKPVVVAFTARAARPLALAWDAPAIITAGAEWIPLTHELDVEPGSILDWSGMGFNEAPAGRHGRVLARDGAFVFADSPTVHRRFYGVNLCFSGQYLEHELADRLADRLQRAGYNALRIHHYERELTGGKPGLDWSAEKLDQLDYLVAALIARGIYLTTDLYVSRPVAGKENPKLMIPVDEAAFQDWRAFTVKFLGRTNPYTKRRYADEPALAWVVMINEGNFANYWKELHDLPQWHTAWAAWRSKRGLAERPFPDDARDPEVGAFLADTERDLYHRTSAVVRDELHCQALLSNANGWTVRVTDQAPRQDYDYADDHFYIDHPSFLEQPWRLPSRCDNRNPVLSGAPGGSHNAFVRPWGKPFTISEFNYSAPGRYRGAGGMLTGALGALQDWSAIWRFAYSHGHDTVAAPQRMNYFDTASDPLNTAAERAAILLFLRGDLAPASRRVTMTLPAPGGRVDDLGPRWTWAAWQAQVGTPGRDAAGKDVVVGTALERGSDEGAVRAALAAAGPADRGLVLDRESGSFTLDTPRLAGGFAEAGGTINASGLRIDRLDQPCSVTVATLDGKPLSTSDRLLLTHLTDVQNSGAHYAELARRTLLDWGALPHLAAVGSARVALATSRPLEVWSLTMAGKRVARIPAATVDGRLVFTVAVAAGQANLYYELVAAK